jgi:hypothetical protein
MLGEAISFPTEGDGGLKTIAIGGILLFPLVAIFLIPLVAVNGYFVRTLDAVVRGEDAPVFDDWGELIVDGIKLIAVGFVYFLVPFVLYMIAAVTFFSSVPTDPAATPAASTVGGTAVLLFLASMLLFLVVGYFAPAGVANFAYTGRLGAAFSFGEVWDIAIDSDYFVALLLVFVLYVAFGVVVFVLTLVTLGLFYPVFLLLGSFFSFYLYVAMLYLVGRGYARSRQLDTEPGPGTDAGLTDPQLE